MISSKCYLVEKEKIGHNIGVLRRRVGDGRVYAVLKANGYGLGCREMTALCSENGLRHFALSDPEDARAVMASGAEVEELLLLSSAKMDEIPRLFEMGVTFTASTEADLHNLLPYPANVHIKVDTGMARRGFPAADAKKIASLYGSYPNLRFTGIYTHFSDGTDRRKTGQQFARFENVLRELKNAGIDPGVRHCCASSSVFVDEKMILDGVRVGTALLGRCGNGEQMGLQRTGICCVQVENVRYLPKGAAVGYGGAFRATRDMAVALCPIGTHNGFAVAPLNGRLCPQAQARAFLRQLRDHLTGRHLPGAVIRGRWCPALGHPCTEVVMLDVTGIDCQPGDTAFFDINPLFLRDVPVLFL